MIPKKPSTTPSGPQRQADPGAAEDAGDIAEADAAWDEPGDSISLEELDAGARKDILEAMRAGYGPLSRFR